MGKVAQIKTSDVRCGGYTTVDRKVVERMLRDGCPTAVVAAMQGVSQRDVRRIARRLGVDVSG